MNEDEREFWATVDYDLELQAQRQKQVAQKSDDQLNFEYAEWLWSILRQEWRDARSLPDEYKKVLITLDKDKMGYLAYIIGADETMNTIDTAECLQTIIELRESNTAKMLREFPFSTGGDFEVTPFRGKKFLRAR